MCYKLYKFLISINFIIIKKLNIISHLLLDNCINYLFVLKFIQSNKYITFIKI